MLITRYDSNLCIDIVKVLESLQGSDTNLELVQSSTMRPLRLFYVYNVVQRTLGFVFAQTGLEDILQWRGCLNGKDGERYPAKEMAELVKKEMMAKDALDITDVEIFVDLSKVQTISSFQDILSKALKICQEEGCRVGIFIVAIGLMIDERNDDLLEELGAPLTDDKLMPFFHLTCAGEAVSMVQLSTWLANHPEINVALIHQYDLTMLYKAFDIETEHLHPDTKGEAGFQSVELSSTEGYSRLTCWLDDVTIKELSDSFRTVR